MKNERFDSGTPDVFRTISDQICRLFDIHGLCDPMYIANSVASDLNCGNGAGEFYSVTVSDAALIPKAASHLQYAYGSNIRMSETQQLIDVISSAIL